MCTSRRGGGENQRGFSLIELMVGLALAAGLAVAASCVWLSLATAGANEGDLTVKSLQGRVAVARFERDLRLASADGCPFASNAAVLEASASQVVFLLRSGTRPRRPCLGGVGDRGRNAHAAVGRVSQCAAIALCALVVPRQQDHVGGGAKRRRVRLPGEWSSGAWSAIGERSCVSRSRGAPSGDERARGKRICGGGSDRSGWSMMGPRANAARQRIDREGSWRLGHAGSILMFVLFACLGLGVLIQGLCAVVLCAERAVVDEAVGRTRLEEKDQGLAALRGRALVEVGGATLGGRLSAAGRRDHTRSSRGRSLRVRRRRGLGDAGRRPSGRDCLQTEDLGLA